MNNPHAQLEQEDFDRLRDALEARFLISGMEEAPETGTTHLQGYVEFSKPVRMAAIKKLLGPIHLEIALGTAEENVGYCAKGEDWEAFGEWPRGASQGKRTDLIALRDALRDGASNRELFDSDTLAPMAFKYQRGIDAARTAYAAPVFRPDIHVELWYGEPGTGKSWAAQELFPGAYWKDNSQWWQDYTGQEIVIWDEFSGSSTSPTDFNKFCDRYPMTVPFKGGSVALRATTFILISNYLPLTWWGERTRVHPDALRRRFHHIRWFRTLGVESSKYDSYEAFSMATIGRDAEASR